MHLTLPSLLIVASSALAQSGKLGPYTPELKPIPEDDKAEYDDRLKNAFEARAAELQSCASAANGRKRPKGGLTLPGQVEILVILDKDGKAESSRVRRHDVNFPMVAECLLREVKGVNYPKPTGKEAVTRVVVLTPSCGTETAGDLIDIRCIGRYSVYVP